MIVAAIVAAVAAAGLAWLLFFRSSTLQDNFNDGALDPKRWVTPGSAEIYERNGRLNFNVSSGKNSDGGSVIARVPLGQIIQDVSARFTLLAPAGGIGQPGGVGLKARLSDGQVLSLDLGPSPEGANAMIWICPNNDAWVASKGCKSPDGPPIKPEKDTSLGITTSRSQVAILIDGNPYYEAPTSAHIRGVELYYYSSPQSPFHVAVDDYYMKYRQR